MQRRLIVLADGTGNAYTRQESNVWRLYQALDLSQPDQIARYIKGVGTSGVRPLALLDGATGFGVPSNVRELYRFLCWNWREGDEIWAFGFSRGAFTIRTLIGLIRSEGLVPAEIDGAPVTRAEMRRNAMAAWRAYRSKSASWKDRWFTIAAARALRDAGLGAWHGLLHHRPYPAVQEETARQGRQVPDIRFLGLFDTVEAYGVPIEALRSAIDRVVWPISFRNRELWGAVKAARHALSLDDERVSFHPLLFDRTHEPAGSDRIQELWFAGVHSDVGGGYPDDALARVPLAWMAGEAERAGLRLRPGALAACEAAASPFGASHDSRSGFGVFYRYSPRRIRSEAPGGKAPPVIHQSVAEKIAYGSDAYAPVALPATALVQLPGTGPVPVADFSRHLPPAARARLEEEQRQGLRTPLTAAEVLSCPEPAITERLRDLIWLRQVAYVLLLLASLGYVIQPFLLPGPEVPAGEGLLAGLDGVLSVALAPAIDSLRAMLPDWTGWWLDPFLTHPLVAVAGVLVLATLGSWNLALRDAIAERARTAWLPPLRRAVDRRRARQRPGPVLRLSLRLARRLRNSVRMEWLRRLLDRTVMPLAVLLALLAGALLLGHRAGVTLRTELLGLCPPSPSVRWLRAEEPVVTREDFTPGDPCWASGIGLSAGQRYRLRIEVTEPFLDDTLPSDLGGFRAPGIVHALGTPFRRRWDAAWFQPVARLGRGAGAEWPLSAEEDAAVAPQSLTTRFEARQSGELFLYVNDALPFGLGADRFYGNNRGRARVTLQQLGPLP